jgi:hypothetical protein
MTLLPTLESQKPSFSKDLNLYEGALNITDCHYTLHHYTKGVIMYPTVISGFTYSIGTEAVLWQAQYNGVYCIMLCAVSLKIVI